MSNSHVLAAVETPDLAKVMDLYARMKAEHEQAHKDAWIGGLVQRFTNEELRVLADYLCIWETLTLRRLGLLGPDEGFDGCKKPRGRQ